jgi:hypothetical protein
MSCDGGAECMGTHAVFHAQAVSESDFEEGFVSWMEKCARTKNKFSFSLHGPGEGCSSALILLEISSSLYFTII